MTNQEVYDYIKASVPDHLDEGYFADKYVKEGYGQVKGGYLELAYIQKEKIWIESADPSQKWHFIFAYYGEKMKNQQFDMDANADLKRIMCPQLMLWISEIAGLEKKILKKALNNAIDYEIKYNTKNSRIIKREVLSKDLHWDEITNAIKNAKTWNEVKAIVGEIKE